MFTRGKGIDPQPYGVFFRGASIWENQRSQDLVANVAVLMINIFLKQHQQPMIARTAAYHAGMITAG